ncbi:MAG: hypothetical protein M3063_01700 [Actinomycetota bacterium]|nr:hypothetical protein [Actinomycetota bacterium]
MPDEMMGEKVSAVIVATPGTQLDVPAVLEHARGKVLKPALRGETEWGDPLR